MYFLIYVPSFIVEPIMIFVLFYRRLRYGYAFRRIRLSEENFAIIDPEDYGKISRYKWFLNGSGYAMTVQVIDGKDKYIRMHHKIIKPDKGFVIDHINHNRIDNRKINLRAVTRSQNSCNTKVRIHSSRFKGVSWHQLNKKWVARLSIQNKRHQLGSFDDEIKAAKAYDEAAKKYHGEFAVLNFLNESGF